MPDNQTITLLDEVKYPTIRIDGEDVEVRFRMGDVMRLFRDQQVNLLDGSAMANLSGIETMERMLLILSYGVSHKVAIAPEDIANTIEWAQMGEVSRVIGESLKKASAQIAVSMGQLATEATPQTPVQ